MFIGSRVKPEWRVEGESHSLTETFSFMTIVISQNMLRRSDSPSESIMGLFKRACESKSPYYVMGFFINPSRRSILLKLPRDQIIFRSFLYHIQHIDEACHNRFR